ncbi:BRO-N domain-containing protein [Roseicella aquatilis]|uniref:BRO-N domain-containing protein n=1 Tax=Roseicella aquatilis TaxID=2527868 RepID=UPI001404F389|nr:BRO family protein [Roseicella aquatilis]
MDEDERGDIRLTDAIGRQQNTVIITEAGLYRLVLRSDRPEAKPFQKWVTGTVLPSIRKNGGYVAGQEKLATGELTDAELLARSILVAQRVIAEKDAKIAALAPKAAIVDEHMESFGRYSLSRFARTLDGVNSLRIKADLQRHGFLYRVGGAPDMRPLAPTIGNTEWTSSSSPWTQGSPSTSAFSPWARLRGSSRRTCARRSV